MKGQEALFSHKSDEWETPDVLYHSLNMEFSFTLDPCATPENAKVNRYFTKESGINGNGGLDWSWSNERVFVNPPYSDIYKWVQKASKEVGKMDQEMGCVVVMLLPARTDTKWFHEFIWDEYRQRPKANVEVRFIKGRLKFKGAENSAPFPSMVVVFR